MLRMCRWTALPMLAAAVAGSAGCAPPAGQREGAVTAVERLAAAMSAEDGSAACAILAPQTREEVQEASGNPCPEAIIEDDLPPPGPVQTVDVYGQWARVVTEQDTIFLAVFGDGWRVVAAGCSSRGERPYECQVKGE
jgi:hypothetical protein